MTAVVNNLHGNAWCEVPRPPADHECWAQTWGPAADLRRMERCPCGAIRYIDEPPWSGKNSREWA